MLVGETETLVRSPRGFAFDLHNKQLQNTLSGQLCAGSWSNTDVV